MLVLTRCPGDKIMIDGGKIVVTVVEVKGSRVKLGIDAPKEIVVDREHIHMLKQKTN